MDVFNRLLAKMIQAPGWKPTDHLNVQQDQIRSYREKRTTAQLAELPRKHTRRNPIRKDCPVIVVVYAGAEWLIDGNNRVNYWVTSNNSELHDVNVHVVEV